MQARCACQDCVVQTTIIPSWPLCGRNEVNSLYGLSGRTVTNSLYDLTCCQLQCLLISVHCVDQQWVHIRILVAGLAVWRIVAFSYYEAANDSMSGS